MSSSKYIANPAFRVHTQSGAMLRSLKGSMQSGSTPQYRLEFDTGVAPHAAYVVEGTRVMLPRDVLWSTSMAKPVQVEMMRGIVKALGKQFRTGATIRFAKTSKGSRELVILGMRKTGWEAHNAALQAVKNAGEALKKRVRQNVSMTDYSLRDLARMDHPYARRHGTIQIHKK